MRALLIYSCLFALHSALTCPPQYQLIDGRCIRLLELWKQMVLDDVLPDYHEECAKDGGHLPVIKNDADQENFADIVYSLNGNMWKHFWLVMDLVCNNTSRRMEWADGSAVTYSRKNSVDFEFDCVALHFTAVSLVAPDQDEWTLVTTAAESAYLTVLCDYDGTATPKPTSTDKCGDYTLMSNPTDDEQPCFKENKFFFRTAVSNNILEGMHIGAHQSPYDSSVWIWADSEIPLDGKAYNNFISVFPIPGGGECTSMLTGSSEAYWINENCDQNMQAFMCRRADFSTLPKTCPTNAPMAGEDIYPPGFPNSDIPCAYILFVEANKRVELEVITLVADINKDFLEILEGTSGPHLLANLTGSILTPAKFTTVTSNVLRVNWAPGGSGSGRGFRIRYNQV